MKTRAALLLTIILAASTTFVDRSVPVLASVPEVRVPQFTLKFQAHPYYVPPTYAIDPFSGANLTTSEGNYVANKSVVITILNEPLAAAIGDDVYALCYNVRFKGHFGDSWTEVYPETTYSYVSIRSFRSGSEHTVLTIPAAFPSGSQVDFQAEAIVWHEEQVFVGDVFLQPQMGGHYETRMAFNGTSGWSNTQAVVIEAIPPHILVLSPQAGEFNSSDVALDIALDQEVSQIKYSLDGEENVTISGNTTLTGLSNGLHTVVVYANGTFGDMGASGTVSFTVAVPEPFPAVPVFAAVAVVAVAGAGLLSYRRKRRREAGAS